MMTVTSFPAWRGPSLMNWLVDHDPAVGVDAARAAIDPAGSGGGGSGEDGGAGAVHPCGTVGGDGAGPGPDQGAVGDGVHEVPVQPHGDGGAG